MKRGGKEERGKIPITGLLCKCLQWLGLKWAKAGSHKINPGTHAGNKNPLDPSQLVAGVSISRKLESKARDRAEPTSSNMEYKCPNQ